MKFTIYNLQFTKFRASHGFTLIELLVVLSIIGVIMGISLSALGGVRGQGRDTQRKGDLGKIASGLDLYRADCGDYPTSLSFGSTAQLKGDGTPASCATTNIYIDGVPQDPQNPTSKYSYSSNGTTYALCAYLETGGSSVSGCGSDCTLTCNYKVTNP
ncbi:prepilin-type N-terminal cleavage/methylation domain-containing protein [Candidatus Microgenomates bacterium]|nr:prepilin-type N-terminal cleavage/methylation domain-containing protein [Candidatus Microgenomates bacterium]